MRRILLVLTVALLTAAVMVVMAAPAFAGGGPNSPGDSGKFNPNSNPCQGPSDQPNCPGPRH